jgi:hypothetical protein
MFPHSPGFRLPGSWAPSTHNPQEVEPFIDVAFCCCHWESSTVVDFTLAIFRKTVNQTAECVLKGLKSEASSVSCAYGKVHRADEYLPVILPEPGL